MAKRVRLLDNKTLRTQLASLERRVGSGDKETVTHPKHANAHDDVTSLQPVPFPLSPSMGSIAIPQAPMRWPGSAAPTATPPPPKPRNSSNAEFNEHILATGGFYRRRSGWR